MRHLLHPYAIEHAIRAICDKNNIQVKFILEKGGTPRTDCKTIYVPKLRESMTIDEAVDLYHGIVHETGHCLYSDIDMLQAKELKENPVQAQVVQALEDNRIERLLIQGYRGDKQIIHDGFPIAYGRFLDTVEENGGLDKVGLSQADIATTTMTLACRDGYPHKDQILARMKSMMSDEQKGKLEEVMQFADELKKVEQISNKHEGGQAILELSRKIIELFPEEKGGGEADKKGEGEGEGQQGEGSGKGKEEGKGGGDGEPDKKKGKSPLRVVNSLSPEQIMPEEKPEYDRKEREAQTYVRMDKGEWAAYPYKSTPVVDFVTKKGTNGARYGRYDSSERMLRHIKDMQGTLSHSLSNKVSHLLQTITRSRMRFGKDKGKLDSRNLYRTCVPDAGKWGHRVFKHRELNRGLDTVVTLLVDVSGSMSGDKVEMAAIAANELSKVLTISQIPHEILAFSTIGGSVPVMYVMKHFDMPSTSGDAIIEHFSKVDLHENLDGDAVMFAEHRMLQRKEARKVLIVLSDGQPAGAKNGCFTQLEDVVKRIEKEKQMEVYAIGIHSTSVKQFYTNHKVIYELDELEPAIFELIKRHIL